MYFSRLKIFVVAGLCALGIVLALPNLNPKFSFISKPVNLGLELRGGSYLQMQVGLDEAYKEKLSLLQNDVRKELRKNKIKFSDLVFKDMAITLVLKDQDQYKDFEKTIASIDSNLSITKNEQTFSLTYSGEAKATQDAQMVNRCIEVVRNRVDHSGTKESQIYKQGRDRLIFQMPGVDNPAIIKNLIGKTARLTLKNIKRKIDKPEGEVLAADEEIVPHKDKKQFFVVEKDILLTGDYIQKVQVTEHNGQNAVFFELDSVGGRKFYQVTLDYKYVAFILDNEVISDVNISAPIPNGAAVISGTMTFAEASNLKIMLSSGSLPAPLKVIEERTVGPSLGNDSIDSGKMAVLISFALVSIFMIAIYRLFGVFACVSLVFNVIFLFGVLSLIGATLTLPGIAGIALTIGMAVDANVLIYERIKEELRAGLKPLRAISTGFERAFSTILDSNITTIIGAAILYEFGSGPIRGFAVTLILGILISMFTALTLTYIQVFFWARNKKLESVPIGGSLK